MMDCTPVTNGETIATPTKNELVPVIDITVEGDDKDYSVNSKEWEDSIVSNSMPNQNFVLVDIILFTVDLTNVLSEIQKTGCI